MKKILIILTAIFTASIHAATLDSDKTQYTSTETISINFKDLTNQKKDWIGIYRSTATSTSWKNVVKWAWTKDKKSGQVRFKDLTEGQYYAKVFYNNSYKTEAKLAFEVKKSATAPVVKIEKSTFNPTENIIVNFKNMTNHNKDWIAIYPAGASNDFDNVVDWEWTGDKSSGALTFNALPKGKYEIRAFYNNSAAIVYAKTTFSIENNNESVNLDFINSAYSKGQISLSVVGKNTYLKPNPTDLIGIYKKGDSNALKNLRSSVLVKDITNKELEQTGTSKYTTLYIDLEPGAYEARYFLNNSFITYKSYPFIVKNLTIVNKDTLAIKAQNSAFDICSRLDKDLIRETYVICPANYPVRDQEVPFAYIIFTEQDSQGNTSQGLYRVNLDNKLLKPELIEDSSYAFFEGKTSLTFDTVIKNNSKLDFIVVNSYKGKNEFTDERGDFNFYYANKRVLQFSYYEDQGLVYNIRSFDNRTKLNVEYDYSQHDVKYKEIYDISNPEKPKLIDKIKTSL